MPFFLVHYRGTEYRCSLDKIGSARNEPAPTTKHDAVKWRDRLRNEIRLGTFTETPPPPAPSLTATFGDVCDEYLKRHVRIPGRRPQGLKAMEILVAVLRRAEVPASQGTMVTLETKPIAAIVKADVEAVRAWRRREQAASSRTPGQKSGACGTNRVLSRLRHIFSWAIAEGYLTDTPFKRGPVSVVKMETSGEAGADATLGAGGTATGWQRARQ